MNNEVLIVQYINAKNCFLHLSAQCFRNILGPSVHGLKLITSSGRELYFSCNSTPCSWVEGNSIGISHIYANVIDLKEKEEVILCPIYNIGSLQSICVTPKSEDDYEILNSTALEVESSLLSQLRIIWPKQAFPIWVSKNITVIVVVDSISPNLKYGRLEDYSEVVVAFAEPKNDLVRNNKVITDDSSKTVSNFKEEIVEIEKLKFRCVPLSDETNNKFCFQPYVVLSKKASLPLWVQELVCANKKCVWRLKKLSDGSKNLVVSLYYCEDNEIDVCDVIDFKTLFISNVLKSHLDLDVGDKVWLELLSSENDIDITGVLISPLFEGEEKKIINDVKDAFMKGTSSFGHVLLNSKAPYPLNDECVSLTLRPLHAGWGFVTGRNINSLTIDVNKYISVNGENGLKSHSQENCDSENFIPSFEDVIKQGKIAIEMSLAVHSKKKNRRFCDNVIYIGKSGCGKTKLVNILLHELRSKPFYIYTKCVSCCSLKGKRIEALSKYLTEILQLCHSHEPSVLFLDDLDLLASISEENTEAAFHINRVSHKIVELIESYQRKNFLGIIATCKSLDHINPKVFSSKGKCLFSSVIKVPDLNKNDRLEFVKKFVALKADLKTEDIDYDYVATKTEGYTPLDLKKVCEKAVFEAWQRKVVVEDGLLLNDDDFKLAIKTSKPTSLHQVNFFKGTKLSWKDIGGLKKVKDKLVEVVCWSTMYPEILSQCPVKPQTGVLLFGAPGTGKTLLASALASESSMNFISIKGPELMSKYIGESEEGVRKLFEKAEAARPCLLFFDEFDSLAPRRGQDQTGVTDRVVNQLLTALDGVDPMSGVWVLAASSRPDLIDPAVLRPGRIGISVLCPLPDKEERLEILRILCSKTSLSEDIDIEEISKLTAGFTGADIKGLFTSAQIKALDILQNEKGLLCDESYLENNSLPSIVLHKEHLMMALKEMKPSLSEIERARYELIYDQFLKKKPVSMKEQRVTHA